MVDVGRGQQRLDPVEVPDHRGLVRGRGVAAPRHGAVQRAGGVDLERCVVAVGPAERGQRVVPDREAHHPDVARGVRGVLGLAQVGGPGARHDRCDVDVTDVDPGVGSQRADRGRAGSECRLYCKCPSIIYS